MARGRDNERGLESERRQRYPYGAKRVQLELTGVGGVSCDAASEFRAPEKEREF